MNLILLLRYEVAFYWMWWLCFIAIGFCLGRYFGLLGVFGAVVLVSILIVGIEVHSVFQDMRQHPESGRDADFVFWFGVMCRIIIYNMCVLPFSIIGWRFRAHLKRVANDSNVA